MDTERSMKSVALGLFAVGVTGWLGALAHWEPGADTGLCIWIWLSLWSLPAGALAGSLGGLRWSWAALLLGLAILPIAAGDSGTSGSSWMAPCVALAALFLLGNALRGKPGVGVWCAAGSLATLVGLLVALPSAGGALSQPWPAEWAALALDLSPMVWVLELGGADWMRHPSVYELAGTADMGPDLRVAHVGSTGPWLLLVLAVALALGREWLISARSVEA